MFTKQIPAFEIVTGTKFIVPNCTDVQEVVEVREVGDEFIVTCKKIAGRFNANVFTFQVDEKVESVIGSVEAGFAGINETKWIKAWKAKVGQVIVIQDRRFTIVGVETSDEKVMTTIIGQTIGVPVVGQAVFGFDDFDAIEVEVETEDDLKADDTLAIKEVTDADVAAMKNFLADFLNKRISEHSFAMQAMLALSALIDDREIKAKREEEKETSKEQAQDEAYDRWNEDLNRQRDMMLEAEDRMTWHLHGSEDWEFDED